MDTNINELTVNGITYVRKDSIASGQVAIPGKRAVIVVDRGWIYAGDVTEENGRIKLSRAVWVFSWDSIGFDGVLKDPKNKNANLKVLDHVIDIPSDSEIFRVPVSDDWGL